MSFSTNLKELRLANDMSQDELAKKVGVCRQAISKWELDISLPDIEHASILAQIFNTSIDSLVDNVISNNVNDNEKLGKTDRRFKCFKIFLGIVISIYFLYRLYQVIELLIICTSINWVILTQFIDKIYIKYFHPHQVKYYNFQS